MQEKNMKLSQFIESQITESHIEASELAQELKGVKRQLGEILLKLSENSQFGHKVSQLQGIETSYFGDIKETGEQLNAHIDDLYNSLLNYGNDDEVAEEEEEEVAGETSADEETQEEK